MTYDLCHSYAIATRCISIPAPVQYAHLAAFRARHHLIHSELEYKILGPFFRNWLRVPEPRRKQLAEEINKDIQVEGQTKYRMYFV